MESILLVEDSPLQGKWMESVLKKDGYRVESALDAESAFAKFSSGTFDVVLTDLRLPGESGIDLCRNIRTGTVRPDTPVVLITGWADPVNVLRGLEAGVDGFVVKGSDVNAILAKIRQVLGRDAGSEADCDSDVICLEFCDETFRIPNDRNQLLNVLLTTFSSVYEISQQYKEEVLERKQAEADLQLAQEQLEARVEERTRSLQEHSIKLENANSELREFAYVASHDLQEPLRKIQAFSARLQDACAAQLSEQSLDYLARMRSAADRMRTLIHDLLEYSRITREGGTFERTNLSHIAHDVLSNLEVHIEETDGRVEVGELPVIDADPTQMQQLLQNLISNSLKFCRDGVPPEVSVTAKTFGDSDPGSDEAGSHESFCELCVADNGIGFDDEYAKRIFNVFQRLHGRSKYEGTGVGLAVCRKIVERHGGCITAQGFPGQGSRFTITLPIHHSESSSIAEECHNVATGEELVAESLCNQLTI